jgi:hypothetical protein
MSYTKTSASGVSYALYRTYSDFTGLNQSGWSEHFSLSKTDSFTGNYNPAWKAEIRNGSNATTPASGTRYTVEPAWFSAVFSSHGYGPFLGRFTFESYEGYPSLPNLFLLDTDPPAALISSVRNRCIAKFIEASDQVRSSFEAGQDLGEIRETIHAIISPFKSAREHLIGYMAKVKKLSLQRAITRVHLRKAIADSFLEFKFGWNPLAADVAAGIAGLGGNQGHPDVRQISASARDFYLISANLGDHQIGENFTSHVTGQCIGEYQVRYKGAIRTGAVRGHIPLLQNLQLDMPHFVPTLWDLIPYSWMVDYFANVGEVIKAASFDRSTVSWGNVTTRRICKYQYNYRSDKVVPPLNTTAFLSEPSGSPSGESVTFSRAAFVGSDLVPDFRFQIPLSAKPWENMTAVLSGYVTDIRKIIQHIRR